MAVDNRRRGRSLDHGPGSAAPRAGAAPGKGSLVQKRYGLGGSRPVQRKAAPGGGASEYTVRAGDTLGAIARRLLGDVDKWQEIAQANSISDPRSLQIGQVLTIPGGGSQAEPTTGSDSDTAGSESSGAGSGSGETQSTPVVHVVQRGDTLGAIARRYLGDAGKWRQIAQANGIDDPRKLKVGQPLTIPGASEPSGQTGGTGSSGQTGETAGGSSGQTGETSGQTGETSGGSSGQTGETGSQQGQTGETGAGTGESTTGEQEPDGQTQGSTTGTHLVTDPRALIRKAPPDLSSTGDVIPAGVQVRILETAKKSRKEYVRVEQVLQEGEEGTPQQYGWTSKANLAGFEGGGHAKEHDESLRPDDAILLSGLGSLDRQMAIIYNAKGKYLHEQAQSLGISVQAAAAVLKVESRGVGFGSDGRMIIRFENHVFYDKWGSSNKATFDKHFRYSSDQRWKGHKFRKSESDAWASCHQSQSQEWEVLQFARGLDNDGALKSISMGAAQIMGFNYEKEGYESVQEMFDHMSGAIKPQLVGMFTFIENTSLCINGLKEGDYVKFARGYNGSGQAQKYGGLIAAAAASYAKVAKGMKYGT